MSQLASFTFLRSADVAKLGVWSKPISRFLRRAVSQYSRFLDENALRILNFTETDGIYVAFVMAALEEADPEFRDLVNPIIHTLARHGGGAHWILRTDERRLLPVLHRPLPKADWKEFLLKIEAPGTDFEWESFDAAREYVAERLNELREGEALLVSVG